MGKKLKKQTTDRGFDIVYFEDSYGAKCSLQKSSRATVEAIWLGCYQKDNGDHNDRMHLTRKQVKKLLPFLKKFAKTGDL